MAGLLQVVDEAEEVVPGRTELVGGADELGWIVLIVVEAGFHAGGGASFPESRQQPVAYPIEEQDR